VTVKEVAFTGNTVFSAAELTQVVASALGTEVAGLDALKALATKVEAYYHQHGYLNARVVLPEQETDLQGGKVTLQVIEPKLGEVSIAGNRRYSEAFLRRALRGIDPGGVLRERTLEQRLLLLSECPGLSAKAALRAGREPGTTDVVVDLVEAAKRASGRTEVNNFGSRQTSREHVQEQVTFGNVGGRGDALTLALVSGFSPNEVLYGQLHYTTPLSANGTKLSLYGMAGNFEVGGEFAVLGMKGNGQSFGLAASHPLVKRSDRSVTVEAGLESADSELELLGARSSYDQIRALKLGVNVEDTNAALQTKDAGSAYLHLGLGERLGGMPDNDPLSSRRGADGRFTKLVVDYTHAKQLDERSFVVATLSGQLAGDSLVAGEQFDIGGANSVRGYPQSELLGDTGLRASLELRHTPALRAPAWLRGLQTVAFLDHGRISNKAPVPGQVASESLTGVGVGLRAELAHSLFLRADVGYALSEGPSNSSRFQPYFQVAHSY